LVLFETPAGFALFKVLKEGKLKNIDTIFESFETADAASKIVKLKAFEKFKDTKQALKALNKVIKGKLPKTLKKFLQKNAISKEVQDNIACSDKKLATSIQEALDIECTVGDKVNEIIRGIRFQMSTLLSGISEGELTKMSLGLSHSLSRYKLKFSSEKVDVMIIQAVALIDDLDKEINNYAMRLKEWYSWHFPELAKIVGDNMVYAQVVHTIGIRTNTATVDLTSFVPEDVQSEIREAAEISMGTEILEEDEDKIKVLCEQVITITEYRASLAEYLKTRMAAIAPNLTTIVGEIVGARLISHAGSLINLAKMPASTVQILGAEKAFFRAIKTKHNTPKYGIIYHASIVGQATPKLKGKISRTLAAKCSLCIRYDALGESPDGKFGANNRSYVESKLKHLESGETRGVAGPSAFKSARSFEKHASQNKGTFNPENDVVAEGNGDSKKLLGKRKKSEEADGEEVEKKKKKKRKTTED